MLLPHNLPGVCASHHFQLAHSILLHTLLYQVRELLVSERESMSAQLKTIPFLEPYPSHANFVLAKVGHSYLPANKRLSGLVGPGA